jgi:succinate dehydrogenase / fumarate reductase cytochrome b subunit
VVLPRQSNFLERKMTAPGLKRSVVNLRYYRGGTGQWAWIFHRVSGLGVLLFLMLHVLDTSSVYFAPAEYNFFVRLYKSPLFGLAEIALGAALIFHAVNGLKVVILDFWPRLWPYQKQAQRIVWALFVILFVPMAGIMLSRLIIHYVEVAPR